MPIETGWRQTNTISEKKKQESFSPEDWTGQISLIGRTKLDFARTRFLARDRRSAVSREQGDAIPRQHHESELPQRKCARNEVDDARRGGGKGASLRCSRR
ncbi:hypothetical protein HL667_13385 [Bradyrhizobium sp. 83012]|uniref:Transposase n=1 Tax=Bradyrhizobium aeschynomenes TaxID=2734909 RepID=A0ABX2CCP4_9BRAD|nr:hypothetical protein [Bradyrhizobium aeschynomenes]NPU65989.1 hypothetical protein [Bradyrhizobium aeschynomenes]